MSADARLVVFASRASNLTSGGDAFSDIYLRDTQSGQLSQLSQAATQLKGGREQFFDPSISPAGTTVAYSSSSGQVQAHFAGLGRTVSSSASGIPGNGQSARPMVPGAGSQVLFDSSSTNLLAAVDGNGAVRDILAKDLNSGGISLISVGPAGQAADGDSFGPWASADGRTVAFWSLASNLSDEPVSQSDMPKMGAIRQALVNASVGGLGRNATYVSRNIATNQLGNGDSINVRLTPDGRYGVFESVASNLVDDDSNGFSDVFRFELETVGARLRLRRLERVSVSRFGVQGNGPSFNPSISDDGQFITFQTDASNLVELDRNGATDILVRWMLTNELASLTRTVDGAQPNGNSVDPMISGDASTIVFGSGASNLTENDDNGVEDVFAVQLREGDSQAALAGRNYSYSYWNPNEPGWGYNLQHQGDLLYGTWYSYADDGEVMFLTVEATPQSPGSFAGPVYRVAGTPFAQINGSPAFTSVTQVGNAQMSFAADGGLSLAYTVNGVAQVRALERFVFSDRAPVCTGTVASRAQASNYSDLWWNSAEAGWGLTLAHQGDVIFALWYTYGAGGRDQWISASSLLLQADGSYRGALQRPASGVPLALINGAATSFPVPEVGTASLRFSDGESGQFSYTLDGVSQSKPIERFVVVGAEQHKPLCRE